MRKIYFLIILFFPSCLCAKDLNLPITLSCTEKAGGGLQKQSNGEWAVAKFYSSMDFKLQIRSFNSVSGVEKGYCETAIIAAGKSTDEYSKLKRKNDTDVCVIQTMFDKQKYGYMGPILKHCENLYPNQINCGDFAVDLEQLKFFDVAPAIMGLQSQNVPVTYGTCQYIKD